MAAGRAFRFLLEGFLAVRYGEEAKDLLARNYPAVGLGLAAALVAAGAIAGRGELQQLLVHPRVELRGKLMQGLLGLADDILFDRPFADHPHA